MNCSLNYSKKLKIKKQNLSCLKYIMFNLNCYIYIQDNRIKRN